MSANRISVAPMMDWTDRHCRYFMRLLSPNAWVSLFRDSERAASFAARCASIHARGFHPLALPQDIFGPMISEMDREAVADRPVHVG